MFHPDKAAESCRINVKIRCRKLGIPHSGPLESKVFLVRWTASATNQKAVGHMLRDNFLADYGDTYIFFGILYRDDEIVEESFRVELPTDLTDGQTADQNEGMAINEAREMAKLYCTPCSWMVTKLDNEDYWVTRIRKDGFEL